MKMKGLFPNSIPITKLDVKYFKMLKSTNTLKSAKDKTASNTLELQMGRDWESIWEKNCTWCVWDVLWSQQRWEVGLDQRFTQAVLAAHPTNGITFQRHDSAYVIRICAVCRIPSLAWFAVTEKFIAPCRPTLFYNWRSNYKWEKSISILKFSILGFI